MQASIYSSSTFIKRFSYKFPIARHFLKHSKNYSAHRKSGQFRFFYCYPLHWKQDTLTMHSKLEFTMHQSSIESTEWYLKELINWIRDAHAHSLINFTFMAMQII